MAKYIDDKGLKRFAGNIDDQINNARYSILKTKGKANGIASLDSKGFVPLDQLGNLDMTFFEVVQALPTSDIKKHIYLIKNEKEGEQDTYDEYIYTGDVDGEYDESKWEKLGDFVPTFDLKEYAKKSEAIKVLYIERLHTTGELLLKAHSANGSIQTLRLPVAVGLTTSDVSTQTVDFLPERDGLMSGKDKTKLDKIDTEALSQSISNANTAADNTNAAISACKTATEGAEKVNAELTDENVINITDRNGTVKSTDLSGAVTALDDIARLKESIGTYTPRENIILKAAKTNKAISSSGAEVTKSGWAIAEFTAEKGNIYLFKPGTIDSDVCIFAEKITSVETRGVDYSYTYNSDGTIATATATYLGKTYAYTYEWGTDVSGNKAATITDANGNVVEYLPMTYETKVGSYSPLVSLNAGAELPEDGYCRYMSHFKGNSSITIAVSYKIDSADLTMKVTRDGVFASISTQLGNLSQKEDETRKKMDEFHGSYMELLFSTDWKVYVDGKAMTIPARKKTRVYPKLSFKVDYTALGGNNYTHPTLIWADVSHLDTSKFKDMSRMFFGCSYIKHLDVSKWDTSNVTNMSSMFQGCSATSLDLSGWDTSNVTNMSSMFQGCSATLLDLSGWDTSNVTNMSSMFQWCSATSLDLSGWDTSNVTNMSSMFQWCNNLQTIKGVSTLVKAKCAKLPSFSVSYTTTSKLGSLDLSGWDTSGATSLDNAFYCTGLTTVDCTGDGWNNINVTSVNRFGSGVGTLKIGKNFFNMPKLTQASFTECYIPVANLLESYDRKANGLPDLTLTLNSGNKKQLTEDNIATLTAKGYIIA